MTDTTTGTDEQARDADGTAGPQSPEEAQRLRRINAWQAAERVLIRPPMNLSLRERLAALTAGAGAVTDLDRPADIYGDGVVAELEERIAGLLGMEAAAFFPTGTMAQQVALRCWAGRTGDATVALHPSPTPRCTSGVRWGR